MFDHSPGRAVAGAAHRPAAQAAVAGEALLAALLGARAGHVTAAPADAGVAQLRKDLTRGRSRPCELVMRVLLADQADGVPTEALLAVPALVERVLRANAPETIAAPPRPLAELHPIETAHDNALDAAQWRQAIEGSPEALRALGRRIDALLPVLEEMRARVDFELYGPSAQAWGRACAA